MRILLLLTLCCLCALGTTSSKGRYSSTLWRDYWMKRLLARRAKANPISNSIPSSSGQSRDKGRSERPEHWYKADLERSGSKYKQDQTWSGYEYKRDRTQSEYEYKQDQTRNRDQYKQDQVKSKYQNDQVKQVTAGQKYSSTRVKSRPATEKPVLFDWTRFGSEKKQKLSKIPEASKYKTDTEKEPNVTSNQKDEITSPKLFSWYNKLFPKNNYEGKASPKESSTSSKEIIKPEADSSSRSKSRLFYWHRKPKQSDEDSKTRNEVMPHDRYKELFRWAKVAYASRHKKTTDDASRVVNRASRPNHKQYSFERKATSYQKYNPKQVTKPSGRRSKMYSWQRGSKPAAKSVGSASMQQNDGFRRNSKRPYWDRRDSGSSRIESRSYSKSPSRRSKSFKGNLFAHSQSFFINNDNFNFY